MSHTVKMETQIKDKEALKEAVEKLGYKILKEGNVEIAFFDGKLHKTRNGVLIKIPNWKYPVFIDLDTGEVKFDNYNGEWGDIRDLNKLKAEYAIRTVLKIARKKYKLSGKALKKIEEDIERQRKEGEKIKIRIPIE